MHEVCLALDDVIFFLVSAHICQKCETAGAKVHSELGGICGRGAAAGVAGQHGYDKDVPGGGAGQVPHHAAHALRISPHLP